MPPSQTIDVRTDLKWQIGFPRPAFEKRHDDPSRDYGIGCVMLHFTLAGPKGALSFDVFTGWYLSHVSERLRRETNHARGRCSFEGHGGQVNWHSLTPMYEGHEASTDCTLLPDGHCYCDVGFLAGDELFGALVEGGEEGLRLMMQQWYERDFESADA